jgi:hypothetical protein
MRCQALSIDLVCRPSRSPISRVRPALDMQRQDVDLEGRELCGHAPAHRQQSILAYDLVSRVSDVVIAQQILDRPGARAITGIVA